MAGWRIVLSGISAQIEGLTWESNNLLQIGRQPSGDIVLNDASVARAHAEVLATPQGWVVRDLGSPGGTLINGVPVKQTVRKLQLQDVLQFGNIAMRVSALEERFQPPPKPSQEEQAHIKASGLIVRVQAVAQRSWEQALQVLATDDQQQRQGKHFLTLLRAGYHLSQIGSLAELLQSILDDTVAVLNAQRGAIVLADEATGELRLRAVSVPKALSKNAKVFSSTLARRCFKQGESLLCSDVSVEADLMASNSITRGGMASIICALLRSPRKRLGVLHLDRGPIQQQFSQDDFYLADAIAASVSVGIESGQLVERQRDLFLGGITALSRKVLELREPHTANHGRAVAVYAILLGEELKLSAEELRRLQTAALLHDIGKLACDDAILRKPHPLDPAESEGMRAHSLHGVALAETIPDLAPIIPIIRSHHERWDGTGYPDGLAGEKIPRLARIIAVGDAFDAMTSDQPYRAALAVDQAFAELGTNAGTQFDPECVKAFLRLRPRVEALLAKERARAPGEQPLGITPSPVLASK